MAELLDKLASPGAHAEELRAALTAALVTTDPGTAPGTGKIRFAVVAGTDAGTAKILIYAGTSTTPLELADNIGSGF